MLPSKRLPFQEWFQKVRNEEIMIPSLAEFVGGYFVHMSGGGVVLNTSNSRQMSSTLRSSGSVGMETVNLYIDYWRSINYFM